MPRIVGGGGGIPPERIGSPDSTESVKETKTSERTAQQESTSPASSEHKLSADTRAVAEHKMMGNLQQMQLNSMLNKMQTKSRTDSPSTNTNDGAILAGDFNYVEPDSESFQKADPISYQSPNTGTSKAWEFESGYPVKWEGPDFDASKNEIAIESLEIAHEGFSPTGSSTPQGVEYPNLTIYVPEQNDTLQSIASKFGITEEALAKANNLNPRDPLPAGIQLRIVPEK